MNSIKICFEKLETEEGADFIAEYLKILESSVLASIKEINNGLADNNYKSISNASHKVKSTFLTCQFDEGVNLAGQLEKLANNQDADNVELYINKMLILLQGVVKEAKRCRMS